MPKFIGTIKTRFLRRVVLNEINVFVAVLEAGKPQIMEAV